MTGQYLLDASRLDQANVTCPAQRFANNGSSRIWDDFADWMDERDVQHSNGAPDHAMPQGKFARWRGRQRDPIVPETCYPPGDFEVRVESIFAAASAKCRHNNLPLLAALGPRQTRCRLDTSGWSTFVRFDHDPVMSVGSGPRMIFAGKGTISAIE